MYEESEPIEVKILCPFCNALWDASMLSDYETTTYGEETGSSTEIFVEIYCSNCKKLVYKKGEK